MSLDIFVAKTEISFTKLLQELFNLHKTYSLIATNIILSIYYYRYLYYLLTYKKSVASQSPYSSLATKPPFVRAILQGGGLFRWRLSRAYWGFVWASVILEYRALSCRQDWDLAVVREM